MGEQNTASFRSKLSWVFVIFWAIYFWRVWSLALIVGEDGIRSGWIGSWSDGAAHLSYMSAFAYRDQFPTEHPLFVGKSFSYPYAADMIGGLLVRAGMSLFAAYNGLGFLLSLCLIVMVWKTLESIFADKLVAFWGGMIFFFGADISNARYLFDETHWLWFDTYDWVDVIAQIMSQRALLLGMPLALFVVLQIWQFSQKNNSTLMMGLSGIVTGLLPIVHVHSLMVLFVISAWLFGLDVYKHKQIRSGWWWYGGIAVALGSGFLLRQINSFDTSFWHWKPGWMAVGSDQSFWWFWLKSWGMWPLLVAFGWRLLSHAQKLLMLPLVLVFGLANLFCFQPNDWDNTKLLTWVYLFFSGVAGLGVVRLLRTQNRLWQLAGGMSVLLMTLSGIVDAAKLLRPQTDPVLYMFSNENLAIAQLIRERTDPESVFLTSDHHLSLIPTLTGRQIVMGFSGWLWTYGIDSSGRSDEVRSMYRGDDEAQTLLNQYAVSYVVFDPLVIGPSFEANEAYFSTRYPIAFSNETIRIYDVRAPSLEAPIPESF
jgi:hypothetical protein